MAGQVGVGGTACPAKYLSGRGRGDLGGKLIQRDAMLRGLGAIALDCA
jgi:hypothetical protein